MMNATQDDQSGSEKEMASMEESPPSTEEMSARNSEGDSTTSDGDSTNGEINNEHKDEKSTGSSPEVTPESASDKDTAVIDGKHEDIASAKKNNEEMPSDEGTAEEEANNDKEASTITPSDDIVPVVPQVDESVEAVPEVDEGVEAVLMDLPSDQHEADSLSDSKEGEHAESSMGVGLVPAAVCSFLSPNDFYSAWMEQQLYDEGMLIDTNKQAPVSSVCGTKSDSVVTTKIGAEQVTATASTDGQTSKTKSDSTVNIDGSSEQELVTTSTDAEEAIEEAPFVFATPTSELLPQEFASLGMTPEEYHEAWKQQVLRDDANQLFPIASEFDIPGSAISVDGSSLPGTMDIPTSATQEAIMEQPPPHDQERAVALASPPSRFERVKKNRRAVLGTVVLVFVIIGAILGLVLALKLGRNNEGDSSSTFAVVFIQPDRRPNETSWEMRDSFGKIVHQQRILEPRLTLHHIIVNRGENYTFSIRDKGGDGICCRSGLGYYYILRANDGKRLVAGNGDFGGMAERVFVP